MKLNQNQSSTQPQTFDHPIFNAVLYVESGLYAIKPNPPTPEAVAKAQFVDKTYQWKGAASNKQ